MSQQLFAEELFPSPKEPASLTIRAQRGFVLALLASGDHVEEALRRVVDDAATGASSPRRPSSRRSPHFGSSVPFGPELIRRLQVLWYAHRLPTSIERLQGIAKPLPFARSIKDLANQIELVNNSLFGSTPRRLRGYAKTVRGRGKRWSGTVRGLELEIAAYEELPRTLRQYADHLKLPKGAGHRNPVGSAEFRILDLIEDRTGRPHYAEAGVILGAVEGLAIDVGGRGRSYDESSLKRRRAARRKRRWVARRDGQPPFDKIDDELAQHAWLRHFRRAVVPTV